MSVGKNLGFIIASGKTKSMGTSQKIEFENAQGLMLAGRMEQPSGTPRATALFAHCFTCSKDIAAATRISRELSERGIAVLRFDFTGLGVCPTESQLSVTSVAAG